MDDHILKRLGQDDTAAARSSSEIDSDCEQRMLQLDGSTGEVQRPRGGGQRRGRLKKLSVFVNGHKQKFSQGGARGVGVKRKRGRPRKNLEPSRILEKQENFDLTQIHLGEGRSVEEEGEMVNGEMTAALKSPSSSFPIVKANGDGFQCNICFKTLASVRAVKIHHNWKHAKNGRRSRSRSGSVNFDHQTAAAAAKERELDELIEQLIPEEDEEGEVSSSFIVKEEQDIKPHILDMELSMADIKNEDELDPGFTCTICGKQFASEKSLKQHKTWKHSDSGPFECSTCGDTFASRSLKTRHSLACHKMRIHAKENSNEDCDQSFEKKESVEDQRQSGSLVVNGIHQESSNKGKSVSYNIAKKKLILKKMRAKAKHQAPTVSTSVEIDDEQSDDASEELKVDKTRLSCDNCRRKFKNEVILEYHKVRCSNSSKGQEKAQLKPSEKWVGRKREKNVMIKREVKVEAGKIDEDDIDLAFFSAKNLELVSEAELVGKLEADLGVYATQFEGEIDVSGNGEGRSEQSIEVAEEEEEVDGTLETTSGDMISVSAKLKQEVTTDDLVHTEIAKDDVADSDGSDHEYNVTDLATIADNDDSDHELFNDSLADMVLEDIAASQNVTNQMYNHGKDMKHVKKVAKKLKLKVLTNKAEKAKLKQKVSDLNLKLVQREGTISTLEKNCDTLTDKCNNGMMQLIDAKEENKNLSLRVLEQIKTIAKLEDGGGQDTDLADLKKENQGLTKQIEESKATIEQLSQQLSAATKSSKSAEKDSNAVEEAKKLKEELVEKDKLMQTYRTTHKELVDQLQQEMRKTKDLLQAKEKEVEESAATIANLTKEKKDLFEAVRKNSQMQGKVKALQKEVADLKAKEAAAMATNKEKESTILANGTLSAPTQSPPLGGAASASIDISALSARDPRKRQRAGINQTESPQKPGLTLTLANFSAMGASSANVISEEARLATFLSPSLPLDIPTYNPQLVPGLAVKSQVTKELEYQEYIERFQFERLERHNEIQEKLTRYKVTRDSIQARIDSSAETELVKMELMRQLTEMKAQRDKDVIEFKMIESQHKDALDIFRKTHSIFAPPEKEFMVEPFNFIPSPKYQPTAENIDENESLRETFSQSPLASDVEGSPVYVAPEASPEYEAPEDSPSPPCLQARGALPRLTRSLSRESDDCAYGTSVAKRRESVNVLIARESSTESSSKGLQKVQQNMGLDERHVERSKDGSRERSNKRSSDGSRERSHRRSSSPKVSRERSPRRSLERSMERNRRKLKEVSGRSGERSPRRSIDRFARRSLERSSRGYRERSPRRSRDFSPRRPMRRKSRENSPTQFSRSHLTYSTRKKLEENELFRQKKAREEEKDGKQPKRGLKECNICNSDSHSQFFCPTARKMFKDFNEWKEFCQRQEICLRCVRLKGCGPKRCAGKCDPFFSRKTETTVDVTCKDCPHDDSAQGEPAGLHYRFCHCVFDQRKEFGRKKEDRRSCSPKRSSSLQPSS